MYVFLSVIYASGLHAQPTIATAKEQGTGKTITYEVKNDLAVIQGDIVLGKHQDVQLNGVQPLRVQRWDVARDPAHSAFGGPATTWPSGIVPYRFHPTYPLDARQLVLDTMKRISSVAAIQFVPQTNEAAFISIESQQGYGCQSAVGRSGSMQSLNLEAGCRIHGIVAHELLHALGFWHEQSRQDRDRYVIINYQNINNSFSYNFDRLENSYTTSLSAYDYDSVMHYAARDFSKNGLLTIEPRGGVSSARLGQRQDLSQLDTASLQKAYGKPTVTPTKNDYRALRNGMGSCLTASQDSAFAQPCNGTTNQRWQHGSTSLQLSPQSAPGYCLAIDQSAVVRLLGCQPSIDQKWSFDGTRFASVSRPNLFLDVSNRFDYRVFVYSFLATPSQQWKWEQTTVLPTGAVVITRGNVVSYVNGTLDLDIGQFVAGNQSDLTLFYDPQSNFYTLNSQNGAQVALATVTPGNEYETCRTHRGYGPFGFAAQGVPVGGNNIACIKTNGGNVSAVRATLNTATRSAQIVFTTWKP